MATPRLAESGSQRLSDLLSRVVSDSPISRVGESPTLWVFLLNIQKPTPRLAESFFDYEYLREFEVKSGTARRVVLENYEDPISAKTPENPPHCHVPLNP